MFLKLSLLGNNFSFSSFFNIYISVVYFDSFLFLEYIQKQRRIEHDLLLVFITCFNSFCLWNVIESGVYIVYSCSKNTWIFYNYFNFYQRRSYWWCVFYFLDEVINSKKMCFMFFKEKRSFFQLLCYLFFIFYILLNK